MHVMAEPIFWVAAGLCVIAELLILRAAFSPPRDAGPPFRFPSPRVEPK